MLSGGDKDRPGLVALIETIIAEAQAIVSARARTYKAMALRPVSRGGGAVAMLFAALMIVQAALAALLVGFVIAVARWLGPAGAALAVFVAALAAAGLLAWLAYGKLRHAFDFSDVPPVVEESRP